MIPVLWYVALQTAPSGRWWEGAGSATQTQGGSQESSRNKPLYCGIRTGLYTSSQDPSGRCHLEHCVVFFLVSPGHLVSWCQQFPGSMMSHREVISTHALNCQPQGSFYLGGHNWFNQLAGFRPNYHQFLLLFRDILGIMSVLYPHKKLYFIFNFFLWRIVLRFWWLLYWIYKTLFVTGAVSK